MRKIPCINGPNGSPCKEFEPEFKNVVTEKFPRGQCRVCWWNWKNERQEKIEGSKSKRAARRSASGRPASTKKRVSLGCGNCHGRNHLT